MTPRRLVCGLVSVLCLVVCARSAMAATEGCPGTDGPWIRVDFEGETLDRATRARVLSQIQAGLATREIEACEEGPGTTPLATLKIESMDTVTLSVVLTDEVTQKTLLRTIALQNIPRDARPLSIAAMAEELLYASWFEAALPETVVPAPPSMSVPAAVTRSNERILRALHRPLMARVGLAAVVDYATGGQAAAGPDLRLVWGGRLTAGARTGFRFAPDVPSVHGSISTRELLLGAFLSFALVPRDSAVGATLLWQATVIDVQLSGTPLAGSRGATLSAIGVTTAAGVGGWVRIGPDWNLVAEASGGAPLVAVTGSDAGDRVTGLRGALLGLALGVEWTP